MKPRLLPILILFFLICGNAYPVSFSREARGPYYTDEQLRQLAIENDILPEDLSEVDVTKELLEGYNLVT